MGRHRATRRAEVPPHRRARQRSRRSATGSSPRSGKASRWRTQRLLCAVGRRHRRHQRERRGRHRDRAQAQEAHRQGLRGPQRHHRRADRGPDRHRQGIARGDPRAAHTPGGAFGSCRYKLKGLEKDRREYERLIEVFKAHDIGYFFYNGGNDSADTCLKVSQLAASMGYPLIAVHVPKTVDNDLPITDMLPGLRLGRQVRRDHHDRSGVRRRVDGEDLDQGLHPRGDGTPRRLDHRRDRASRRRSPATAPHILLFPEIPFDEEAFLARGEAKRGRSTATARSASPRACTTRTASSSPSRG